MKSFTGRADEELGRWKLKRSLDAMPASRRRRPTAAQRERERGKLPGVRKGVRTRLHRDGDPRAVESRDDEEACVLSSPVETRPKSNS